MIGARDRSSETKTSPLHFRIQHWTDDDVINYRLVVEDIKRKIPL